MTRKSPYEHKVKGHYREGKFIENFDRGTGKKPKFVLKPRTRDKPTGQFRKGSKRGNIGPGYNVTFMFPSGGSESYNTGGTATGALKDAVSRIQRPEMPKSATLRRTT